MITLDGDFDNVRLEIERRLLISDTKAMGAMHNGIMAATALVSDRIKQEGRNARGELMETQSHRRIGPYSERRAHERMARGRQVARVDLYDTGALANAFQVLAMTSTEATAGFLNDREAQKATRMEDYYGNIWGLTNQEQADVRAVVIDELLK